MARRNANGEGTIYPRKDGRWEGAIKVLTSDGKTKRVRVYGASRAEAHKKLTELKAKNDQGIPVADRSWLVGDYLDYWLAEVVKPTLRPSTYDRYETAIRLYLKPGLGGHQLTKLSVPAVQTFLNQKIKNGMSVRSTQILREVLRSTLTRATEEELVARNVAQRVRLPKWEREDIQPWTAQEARAFLKASEQDPLHAAFVILVLYGLRRGEVLGLRWRDIDFPASIIRIRQQVQRVGGSLQEGPVKTASGRRDLPLLSLVRNLLVELQARLGFDADGFVFSTRTGRPLEPRNFVRSFQRIIERNKLRRITVHQVRHTAATLLKDLGVPARDTQTILGHSDISITQQIYQHTDMVGRREALSRVEEVLRIAHQSETAQDGEHRRLREVGDGSSSRQFSRQVSYLTDEVISFLSGTPGRIRTYDTWFRSSIDNRGEFRATEAKRAMEVCTRHWTLGIVAVSLAVKKVGDNQPTTTA